MSSPRLRKKPALQTFKRASPQTCELMLLFGIEFLKVKLLRKKQQKRKYRLLVKKATKCRFFVFQNLLNKRFRQKLKSKMS